MTQQTLDLIHQSYQEALSKSGNIIQIVENLCDILVHAEVCEADSKTFGAFIDGLRNCIGIRKMTSDITDVVTNITITIMHIIRWLNVSRKIDIDINLHGRRKSLESDLTKLLRKSNETLSAKIRDRFGLRGTLLNECEEEAIAYIYLIFESITGILAAKNKMRDEFIAWVKNSNYVNSFNKTIIKAVLEIPFDVDGTSYKDFIGDNKKPNGYESLHFTLVIQPYSPVIRGCQLEIQLRTKKMDDVATSGSASHKEYKKYLHDNLDPTDDTIHEDNPLLKVFVVDDFSKLNIIGFTSYNSKEDDEDGIHYCKEFANRRESPRLFTNPGV